MTRSKVIGFSLIVLLPFIFGCASSGLKTPTVFADRANNIPADIPSQFLNRYQRFINGKEAKEFKKLTTDEERQKFIDDFWLKRDTNPSTPENEYKQMIDERIDDIASERYFSGALTGLLFRTNGGFTGDMAKIYLLHGEPDAMDALEGGNTYVPLMLWVYLDRENGRILSAYMFYQKYNSGTYSLFSQDGYQMDACGALYEVATARSYNYNIGQGCSDDLNQVFNDIYRSMGRAGIMDGNIFAWALFNFSQDSTVMMGSTLNPPKPAAEIAKQSSARVVGEAPKLTGSAGTDYVLATCDKCNSVVPAELQLAKEFTLSINRNDTDWQITGNQLQTDFKFRVVLENIVTNSQIVVEKNITLKNVKDSAGFAGHDIITLMTSDEVAQIPAGTYRLSVYLKNMMTRKYNAWSVEFTK